MTLTSKLEQPGRSPLVIIRVFRAQIHPGKEGEFERFVRETGVPRFRRKRDAPKWPGAGAAGATSPSSPS
jgi:hypothetical protein